MFNAQLTDNNVHNAQYNSTFTLVPSQYPINIISHKHNNVNLNASFSICIRINIHRTIYIFYILLYDGIIDLYNRYVL